MASGGRFILRFLILVLLSLMGGSVFSLYSLWYEQNDVAEPTVILVEKGDNLTKIARRLKKEGLINSVSIFKTAARFSGKSAVLKAGEYRIPAHASAKEILDILVTGQTTLRRVMIPEGKTSRQIFEILTQTSGLTGILPEPPPNGSLLPETYTFSYGMPREIIVDRMKSGMNKTIDELWPGRDSDLPYTTKEEALVLASIIEKETSVASERPHIAGVFINRLRKGMRLQTDPTVIYAVTGGTMELKRRLTHSDLKTPHPFNTYVNKGLPPAPICNPGRESIQAVLKPQRTNDIYFVADGTGGHAFAQSFEEHRRNILNWKKKIRKKNSSSFVKKKNGVKTIQMSDNGKDDKKSVEAVSSVDVSDLEKQDEILEQQDMSLDIVDDLLREPAFEKKAEIQKAEEKVSVLTEKASADSLHAQKKTVRPYRAKKNRTGKRRRKKQ